MNKNRIVGRHGATSWHNTAKSTGLPVEVNAAVAQQSNALLPGEALPGMPGQGVSRGRSTEGMNRGAGKCPFKLGHPQA